MGTGIMLLLRVQYYEWMGYQPNMAPQVAYLFSPLIFGVVCLVVLPSEWLMRKWRKQRLVKPMSAVLIGAAYATLLVVWAFPSHASVALLINPVTLRVLLWWRYQADAQAD